MTLARRFLLATPALLMAPGVRAHSTRLGAVQVGHAWMLPGVNDTQGFVPLGIDRGEDALVAVSIDIARAVEIRRVVEGRTERLERLPFAERGPVGMRPGAIHLAILGLARPVVSGERIPARFTFARAGAVAFEFWVESAPYATR